MNETLKLNFEFYSEEALKKSINDFKEAAKISFEKEKNYFIIKIEPKDNTPNLKEEFANYVFGLTKNKRVM